MSNMRQFRRSLRATLGKPLAYQIKDGFGAALAPFLERVIRGERVHDAEIVEVFARDAEACDEPAPKAAGPIIFPSAKGGKATALVSVRGVAMYDLEFQPFAFSTLLLSQTMNALANDPEIGTIVLDIDSPGGEVTGTPEAADAIFAARQKKTVMALVNPLAASAAYWIASQATEIVAVPSADVGSIGVFMLHVDCSGLMEQMGTKPTFIFAGEHKVEGNSFEPLSEEAAAFFQGEVNQIYRDFLKAVARGRGKTVAEVERDFGQGRTFMAPVAKRVGMIDRIATIDSTLARAGVVGNMDGRRRGEADEAPKSTEATMVLGDLQTETDDRVTYAHVGGPPDDWYKLAIIDEKTGEEVTHVIEVDCAQGWLIRHKLDEQGNVYAEAGEVATERIEGFFRIERREEPEPDETEDDTCEAEREARHRRLALLKRA